MTSLSQRVRGEQVPINGSTFQLLEVVADDHSTPFWRARCGQSGQVFNLALDGMVQTSPMRDLNLGGIDYLAERKKRQRRRRYLLMLACMVFGFVAYHHREQLLEWYQLLREWLAARQIRLPEFAAHR